MILFVNLTDSLGLLFLRRVKCNYSREAQVPRVVLATYNIQLFQERLSEKVHGTIPKGLVGGFEFTVLQRILKEWHKKP